MMCLTNLIVTFDEMRAKQIYEGYQFFDENTLYYPARDLLFYQSDIHSNALTRERLSVVQALIEHRPVTVVTTMGCPDEPRAAPFLL